MSKQPDWSALFDAALKEPGRLASGYSLFHNYSLGNQLLAMEQLDSRGLPIAPIAPMRKWNEMGRRVKKGQKAISLYMPVTIRTKAQVDGEDDEEATSQKKTIFMLKARWFSYHQTEGEPLDLELPAVDWDSSAALDKLGISMVDYSQVDGNVQGYALPAERKIAINPLAQLPWKTTFHEIAHCLLHGDQDRVVDGKEIDQGIMEAEAEMVAYLCCSTLGLPGIESSRAYIQSWLSRSSESADSFKQKSTRRIFGAADQILKAGANEGTHSSQHQTAAA